MWEDINELQKDQRRAKVLTVFFVFCSINLFAAIVLTIKTPPGHIPEDTEWDMPCESEEDEEEKLAIEEQKSSGSSGKN